MVGHKDSSPSNGHQDDTPCQSSATSSISTHRRCQRTDWIPKAYEQSVMYSSTTTALGNWTCQVRRLQRLSSAATRLFVQQLVQAKVKETSKLRINDSLWGLVDCTNKRPVMQNTFQYLAVMVEFVDIKKRYQGWHEIDLNSYRFFVA